LNRDTTDTESGSASTQLETAENSATQPSATPSATDDPAALAAKVLEEEAKRQAEQQSRDDVTILPDDLLPGVGGEPMALREAIKFGGVSMLTILFLLNILDELDRVAIAVLAPDIQETLNVSDTVLLGVTGLGGVALVLGAVPMAFLADRIKRVRIVQAATIFWSGTLALMGAVVNIFQYFLARVTTGLGQSNRLPVHSSLLADAYPLRARARVFAFEGMGRPIGQLAGPILAGTIAAAAGGPEGWRWAFFIFAIPPAVVAVAALILKEPIRARHEQQAILGEEKELPKLGSDLPVSLGAAYQRLKKIKTFYFLCVGVGALGFALITVPVQLSLLLDDSYGYGAYTRGWMISLTWVASLLFIPIAGSISDRLFRADPGKMVRFAGSFVAAYGVLILVALRFNDIAILLVGVSLANGCTSAAFVTAGPTIGAIAPYRMRAQAFALLPVFIFLMGGFFGGIIAGTISDAHGERLAISVIAPPSAIIAGFLVAYGSRYIKRDISLSVQELQEEQQEMERMIANPDGIPVLQVRNLDYSYGPVQVLFDVGLEIPRGETLALLGTNGAGKSTLLRAVSGLGIPDRGVVRLNGRTITYVSPELRFKQGIVQVRGGTAVFGDMTVEDNLKTVMLATKLRKGQVEVGNGQGGGNGQTGGHNPLDNGHGGGVLASDNGSGKQFDPTKEDRQSLLVRTLDWPRVFAENLQYTKEIVQEREERVYGTFPILAEKRDQLAQDLSGGQQQMLALGMALMHKPEILLIDELSLGLAPLVVQELLEVVEQLKEQGQTMLIVEQSVNVALTIADRAIFMEKGRVQFEGSAQELAQRDDLVRAVFLGGEGG